MAKCDSSPEGTITTNPIVLRVADQLRQLWGTAAPPAQETQETVEQVEESSAEATEAEDGTRQDALD